MFDFWKEVIINDINRFGEIETASGKTALRVLRCADYFVDCIVDKKVYRTAPVDGAAAKINLATVVKGHTDSRLVITLGLVEGHADSEFARPWAAFKNSIAVEFNDLASLKAALRLAVDAHIASVVDDELVLVDPRVVVKDAFVYDRSDNFENYTDMEAAVTANVAPVGTGEWILENLRFPTHVNTYVGAPNVDDMPVANGKYVQYAFEYCVPKRGFHGQGAVGEPMASVTHHIFYVLESVDDKAKFTDLGLEVVDIKNGNSYWSAIREAYQEGGQTLAEAPKKATSEEPVEDESTQEAGE